MNAQVVIIYFILGFIFCGFPESSAISRDLQCQPWSFLSNNSNCQCYENNDRRLTGAVYCNDHGTLLQFGFCMTHEEDSGTFLAQCPYFVFREFNITKSEYIQLPNHIYQLNTSMCDPLNRKGRVCSECKEGYAIAINSFNYKCIECSEEWYGILYYIPMQFIPITVFYIILLVFRVNVTSAPMTCFIMYSQLIVYVMRTDKAEFERLRLQSSYHLINIIKALYGVFNLDFIHKTYELPEVCINKNLKIIHVQMLDYVSAVYMLCLLILTWICIELHDRNFKPLVCLWRPFHRCCFQLRKEWNTKYDILDVFASLFLLSSGKLMYQSLQLLGVRYLWNRNGSHELEYSRVTLLDPTVAYFSPSEHLPFAILGVIFLVTFTILPSLILVLYPTKTFRALCKLNGKNQSALQIFVEKFHYCYRDGLHGGKDIRSFSGLYFFLRGITMVSHELSHLQITENTWFICTLLFSVVALVISYVKPYKEWYMNLVDTVLLSLLAMFFILVNIHTSSRSELLHTHLFSAFVVAIASIPLFVFIIYVVYRIVSKAFSSKLMKKAMHCCSWRSCPIQTQQSYQLLS